MTPKSVLITGASSGIGKCCAVALAADGWQVFASMRDPGARVGLDEQLELAGLDRHAVDVVELDVTKPDTVRATVAHITAVTGGRLDALVSNAGVNVEACFEDIPSDAVRAFLDTTVLGVLTVTREVLPVMRAQRSGRILVMSSMAANGPGPIMSLYGLAKRGMEGFFEALAQEVDVYGIEITILQPGLYATDLFNRNSGRVRPAASAYAELYDRVTPLAEWSMANSKDPAVVASRVVKILNARRVRFRRQISVEAHLMSLARALPSRARWQLTRASTNYASAYLRRKSKV